MGLKKLNDVTGITEDIQPSEEVIRDPDNTAVIEETADADREEAKEPEETQESLDTDDSQKLAAAEEPSPATKNGKNSKKSMQPRKPVSTKRLAVYPYVQLAVVIIFVIIAIFALFSMMKSEQNKVWVGLSKETAHQLGTPISSLMAWSAVLKEAYPEDELIPEMENDIKRLERIAERFSKIGSIPEPKPEDLCEILERVVNYMDKRTSNKVKITAHLPEEPVIVNMVASLFEWVGENLCKNAVDAMSGSGKIDIFVIDGENKVDIEVVDTGKGISKNQFKSVFKPGFTTKKRGWGLGLSLAKRIVEEYHKGRIYVKSSEIGVGTTFKIELPK